MPALGHIYDNGQGVGSNETFPSRLDHPAISPESPGSSRHVPKAIQPMTDLASLHPFFAPRSIAVCGASSRKTSVGYAVFKNLLKGAGGRPGFPGPVYPIDRKGGELLGEKVLTDLADCPEVPELIVIAIPPKYIPDLIDQAGGLGIKAAIVISAGFAEMGHEGQALQDRMSEVARSHGMRLVGPNCLGIVRPSHGLNASFAATTPRPGKIGLLSQSGAIVTGVFSKADVECFGLSAAISLGSKADVEDQEVLRWLAADEQTKCVTLYVEEIKEPAEFLAAAREMTPHKPIVAIKGGITAAGAKAACSHTGSLAGSAAAYHAAFVQAGILEVKTFSSLVGWSRTLADQPPAPGDRIVILTNAGGPGVISADHACRLGLRLAELEPDTLAALDEVLPSVWSRNNPVDIIGDATPERYKAALGILGKAPEVDGIVTMMTLQFMTDPLRVAMAIVEANGELERRKPVTCSIVGMLGSDAGHYLDEHGVPDFNVPEDAVSAMAALVRRGRWLSRSEPPAPTHLNLPPARLTDACRFVKDAQAVGQRNLDLSRARDVLMAAGIRYNRSGVAENADEAVRVATEIGYPVVVKLNSPDVIHKSDVGAVEMNLIDEAAVREACHIMLERVEAHQPGARVTGYTVEQMITGTEVIVGMTRDPNFGPLLMVGIGGIFVEVYKDVTFRLVPLTRRDALDMIDEIKGQALFNGARKRPLLDRAELAEVLLRISALVEYCPEILELDLNPLVITTDGLVAVDARVITSTK